jgi:hypothetical protein
VDLKAAKKAQNPHCLSFSCSKSLYVSTLFGLIFSDLRDGHSLLHCEKKFTIFPSPAGMSLTKLSLAGNNLIILGQGEFGQ